MEMAHTVEEFYDKNTKDIDRILRRMTKIFDDEDALNDLKQNLYLYLYRYGTVGKFSPDKGTFKTYMYNCISNFLKPVKKREQKVREALDTFSCAPDSESEFPDTDVFDLVHGSAYGNQTGYSVDKYHPLKLDSLHDVELGKLDRELEDFSKYLSKTKESPCSVEKMDKIIEYSVSGINNTDIGTILDVSVTMVCNHKRVIADHFKKFRSTYAR